jgi:hypothetical protein
MAGSTSSHFPLLSAPKFPPGIAGLVEWHSAIESYYGKQFSLLKQEF